jgi:hypothetical protein
VEVKEHGVQISALLFGKFVPNTLLRDGQVEQKLYDFQENLSLFFLGRSSQILH